MPYSPTPGANPYTIDSQEFLRRMMAEQAARESRAPPPAQPQQQPGAGFGQANGLLNLLAGSGQVGGGGLSTAGRADALTGMSQSSPGVGSYIAPAAAMYGLIKGGNKLNIGLPNQVKAYNRLFSDSTENKLEKLLPWKWF